LPEWNSRIQTNRFATDGGNGKEENAAGVYKSFVRYFGQLLTMAEFFAPTRRKFSTSEPLVDSFQQIAAVYACAEARARPLASCPLKVYERKSVNGVEVLEEVLEHPLVEMVSVPNPIMSRYQFVEAWELSAILGGECFYFLDRNGFTDVPKEVWLLPPGRVEEITDSKGVPVGWEYDPGGDKPVVTYDLWQVMHEKLWNPNNYVRGLSPLVPLDIVLQSEWAALQFNHFFLDRGCTPSGRYEMDGFLTDDMAKMVLAQHKDKYAGAENTGETMIDEGGLKWKPHPIPQKDAQFMELRTRNLNDIMMALGCNHGALGLPDTNYAQLKIMLRHFWTATLIPRIRAMEDAMWKDITRHVDNGKYELLFDLNAVEALREDLADKATASKTYWEMGVPFKEVNRNMDLGFEEFEGWEESHPKTGPSGGGFGTPPEKAAPVAKDVPEEFVDPRTPEDIEYAEKFEREVTRPLEKRFEAKMRRFFIEHQREMFEKFKKQTGWKGAFLPPRSWRADMRLAGLDLPDLIEYGEKANAPKPGADFSKYEFMPQRFEQEKKLKKFTKPLYEEALLQGAALRSGEIGGAQAISEIDEALARWIEKNGLDKAKDMVGTLQDQLKKSLAEGLREGETLAELAARIKHIHKSATNRSMTIARTEVGRAAEHGAYEEAKASDAVESHRWITAGDDAVRHAHITMHGQERKIGERFDDGMGNSLLHPHDPDAPIGTVANCRCVLEPILKEE
jgi:HK97 family phage portal protein